MWDGFEYVVVWDGFEYVVVRSSSFLSAARATLEKSSSFFPQLPILYNNKTHIKVLSFFS